MSSRFTGTFAAGAASALIMSSTVGTGSDSLRRVSLGRPAVLWMWSLDVADLPEQTVPRPALPAFLAGQPHGERSAGQPGRTPAGCFLCARTPVSLPARGAPRMPVQAVTHCSPEQMRRIAWSLVMTGLKEIE